MKTRSQVEAENLVALYKSRHSFIWIVTGEEARVEGYIAEASKTAAYVPYFWDCVQGVTDLGGKPVKIGGSDAGDMLGAIQERSLRTPGPNEVLRSVWIMRDLPVWLEGPGAAGTVRACRNLARSLPGIGAPSSQVIVVLSPSNKVPAELQAHATVIEWPLPDREEIADILDRICKQNNVTDILTNGKRDAAIDAAVGLSGEEAQACYSKCLVQLKTIDPVAVAQEKKRIVARERVIEWYDPLPEGLDAVGGLENLKSWFLARTSAYSPAARAYGLPMPKGMFLIGISGCGKTLCSKAIATVLQCPLLRVDLGALKGSLVGQSEGNLRKVFEIVKTIRRCVVWFDEVEKSLQGAVSGSSDGGVSADALGAILTWMQERQGEAFVIMTANDVSALPPEFLRKGRFDEVWWLDLPNATERVAVLNAALRANGRGKVQVDAQKIADACKDFTGAEIAAIVPDALYTAFADGGREIDTKDLLQAASTVVPLSKTAAQKLQAMRSSAAALSRPASRQEEETEAVAPRLRALEM